MFVALLVRADYGNPMSLCGSVFARAVIGVVKRGTPFKVIDAVVGLHLVFVVYHWQIVGVGDEGQRNKAVYFDTPLLSVFIERDAYSLYCPCIG